MSENGGIDIKLLNEAQHRVCRRLGDKKLNAMWSKLGPTRYFRKIRNLTDVEYNKLVKGLNAPKRKPSVMIIPRPAASSASS
jgi:hypothetical protein